MNEAERGSTIMYYAKSVSHVIIDAKIASVVFPVYVTLALLPGIGNYRVKYAFAGEKNTTRWWRLTI